jgi:hypothetical protein
MTMVRLSEAQRRVLAEKLPDLANLFVGGLVIGPFLGAQPVSAALVVVGATAWVVFMAAALYSAEGAS